jgi:hypothetical protein
MGALQQKKKQAPRCMRTLSQFGWSRQVPQKRPPYSSPNRLFYEVLCAIWIPHERHRCRTDTYQNERHAAWERDSTKNNEQSIGFTTFLTPSLSPTWGTKRNIKNCEASATLHGSAPTKKERAPRCMGMLSQFGWSRRVPKKRPSYNSPNRLF